MARAGDKLINPVTGMTLVFRKTGKKTNGALLEVDAFYRPNSSRPLEHYHPQQEEHFEVVTGTMQVLLNGHEQTLAAGDILIIPPNTPHAMWNAGSEETHLIWQTRPALNTERLFETLYALARDGKVDAKGVPNLLQGVALAREFHQEYRVTRPPRFVQTLLFTLLGPVARWLGYAGDYAGEQTPIRKERPEPPKPTKSSTRSKRKQP
jgi:quercetin dioxygenase-like cupin family protein